MNRDQAHCCYCNPQMKCFNCALSTQDWDQVNRGDSPGQVTSKISQPGSPGAELSSPQTETKVVASQPGQVTQTVEQGLVEFWARPESKALWEDQTYVALIRNAFRSGAAWERTHGETAPTAYDPGAIAAQLGVKIPSDDEALKCGDHKRPGCPICRGDVAPAVVDKPHYHAFASDMLSWVDESMSKLDQEDTWEAMLEFFKSKLDAAVAMASTARPDNKVTIDADELEKLKDKAWKYDNLG
jgi:hypothetical protein